LLVKESPSENPPHVTQDPVTVLTSIRRLISKIRLVSLNPCVCVFLAEMPVLLAQIIDEFVCI
jgi:hypothetical protein